MVGGVVGHGKKGEVRFLHGEIRPKDGVKYATHTFFCFFLDGGCWGGGEKLRKPVVFTFGGPMMTNGMLLMKVNKDIPAKQLGSSIYQR